MLLQKLQKKKLIYPPKWLPTNTHYMAITGSVAYGCSSDTSDQDICGFCIPSKEQLFPYLSGEILGFGTQKKRFNQWQEPHIKDGDAEYDFSIYSIVRFFQLTMQNNPNMLSAIFVPQNCIIHSTSIGTLVRENRKMFLHKGCWPRFKGYSFQQLNKIKNKQPEPGSRRAKYIEKFSYDVKFAYHVVRLLDEVEQILTLGDLDLQRGKEMYKSIRRGEWKEQDIIDYFTRKEKDLEKIYAESKLPWGPDEEKIKQLLLQCLEIQYGSLDKVIHQPNKYKNALREISKICENVGL